MSIAVLAEGFTCIMVLNRILPACIGSSKVLAGCVWKTPLPCVCGRAMRYCCRVTALTVLPIAGLYWRDRPASRGYWHRMA